MLFNVLSGLCVVIFLVRMVPPILCDEIPPVKIEWLYIGHLIQTVVLKVFLN